MIVLSVIGILSAILLPVALHSMPNDNLMKFKKAHNTLGTVIKELVTSDKYYKDGDYKYFCNTFADMLNTKQINCSESTEGVYGGWV